MPLAFDNAFARLGEGFFTRVTPTPLLNPSLGLSSARACALIGLDSGSDETRALMGAHALPEGADPVAQVYAGHQFGGFSPRLGDGRGVLIGEVNGWDLHLKGAGQTPYSRFGDGRAVIRSSVREIIGSEFMAAVSVPTSRAALLAVSDTPVQRERIERAASLLRLARTHVRLGHFEYFQTQGQLDQLAQLVEHVLARFGIDGGANPALTLFNESLSRNAGLVAQWQTLGFCHGVMNTDNISIIGDTLDYGPFGFLDQHDPTHVCNHSDHQGRYRFENQPGVMKWNLACLAEALIPLAGVEPLRAAIGAFDDRYRSAFRDCLHARLGPVSEEALFQWLGLLELGVDHTLAYRYQAEYRGRSDGHYARLAGLFSDAQRPALDAWLTSLHDCVDDFDARARALSLTNPRRVPRNWICQQIIEFGEGGDWAAAQSACDALFNPFDEADPRWDSPPPESMRHLAVSCSS